MEIAKITLSYKWFAVSVEWAEAAKEKDPNILGIVNLVTEAQDSHDSNWKAPNGLEGIIPNEKMFVSRIIDNNGSRTTAKKLRKEEHEFFESQPLNHQLDDLVLHNFYKVCRGEILAYLQSNDLKCELAETLDPFLVLAPVKKEILSRDPPLFLFHEIISQNEMDYFTDVDADTILVRL